MYIRILVKIFFFREKKITSVFYIHVHMLLVLASKHYDMKERNEKKNDKVFFVTFISWTANLDKLFNRYPWFFL